MKGRTATGNAIPQYVPEYLSQFPDVEIPGRFRDTYGSDGTTVVARRPYCNKKLAIVAPGMNPFTDFFMFARAPVAGHIVGMILDDLANEFDPYAPSFGEKYAPPFMPISIRDYAGNEINRVYSDRYGTYNAMVPSTFAYNVPLPSGVAPNMVNVCLNSPTFKDPVTGVTTIDPHYNPQYTQYCYSFQYLPGKTTYLDTPVLPIAAFAGPSQFALDTDLPDGTPGIKMVAQHGATMAPSAGSLGADRRDSANASASYSMGNTIVSNPAYEQNNGETSGTRRTEDHLRVTMASVRSRTRRGQCSADRRSDGTSTNLGLSTSWSPTRSSRPFPQRHQQRAPRAERSKSCASNGRKSHPRRHAARGHHQHAAAARRTPRTVDTDGAHVPDHPGCHRCRVATAT